MAKTFKSGLLSGKRVSHNETMSLNQLKAFLTELQKNKELLNAIRVAATANEIKSYKPTFFGKLFTVVGLDGKRLAKAKTVDSGSEYIREIEIEG